MTAIHTPYSKKHVSAQEQQRRMRRKDSYHLVGSRNHLPMDPEEEEEAMLFRYLLSTPQVHWTKRSQRDVFLRQAKQNFLHALARAGGEVKVPSVLDALKKLTALVEPGDVDISRRLQQPRPACYEQSDWKPNEGFSPLGTDGMWIEISRPKFCNSMGKTAANDYLYTLGRMSFGIFNPENLVCSIQGLFNPIHSMVDDFSFYKSRCIPEQVLDKLEQLAEKNNTELILRTYDVVAAFTIEPNMAENRAHDSSLPYIQKPIEGLMTTYGYAFPDPDKANRLSVCFTSGSLELVHERHTEEWKQIFRYNDSSQRSSGYVNKEKIIVHMEDDGKLSYHLPQPKGDGNHYVDLLFLDETLRIVQSSGGNVFVFARVPRFGDE